MYRLLVRPLLFLLPAETAHHLGLWVLRVLSVFPGLCRWLRRRALRAAAASGVDLSVQLGGLRLEHPLALAAGFDKDAAAVPGLFALGFSAVEVGTVTPRPQPGNPRPRMFRLPRHAALINRLGFNNRGAGAAAGRLDALRGRAPGPVGANLGKNKDTPLERAAGDYLECARALAPRADYVVVNASSPNTPGLRSLQEPDALRALLSEVKEAAAGRPVFLKIAPDLAMEAVDQIVDVAVASGAQGLIATNTTVERPAALAHPRAGEAGGLSGAPLSAQAAAVLARAGARAAGRLALIGSGGVMSAEDAYRRIRAGASAVQLYTGFIYGGPGTVPRWLRELAALLRRDGFKSVSAAIGADLRESASGATGATQNPAR